MATGTGKRVHWVEGMFSSSYDMSDEEQERYSAVLSLMRKAHTCFYKAYKAEKKFPHDCDNESRSAAVDHLKKAIELIDKIHTEFHELSSFDRTVKIAAHALLRLSYDRFYSGGVVQEWKILQSLGVEQTADWSNDFKKKKPQFLY